MLIGQDHIKNSLRSLIANTDKGFDLAYDQMNSPDKEKVKDLLIYTDKVLNKLLFEEQQEIAFHHIYYTSLDKCYLPVLLEFTAIKLFYFDLFTPALSSNSIKEHLTLIQEILQEVVHLKENVSGGDKAYRQATQKKKELRQRKKFYEKLLDLKTELPAIFPSTLINLHKTTKTEVYNDILKKDFFAIPVEMLDLSDNVRQQNSSFVVLNSEYDRDELDELILKSDHNLIDGIRTVVLFDCEDRGTHTKFAYSNLVALNRSEGTGFKRLIIFSFDHHFKLSKLLSHIERTEIRYFVKPQEHKHQTYCVLPIETDLLLHAPDNNSDLLFVGENNLIYEEFREQVGEIDELMELTSIKMRSIYSLCFNEKCKELILADIFSTHINEPHFISRANKTRLLQLNPRAKEDLSSSLDSVLSTVLGSDLKTSIERIAAGQRTYLIVPKSVISHKSLSKEILRSLDTGASVELIEWPEIKTCNGPFIVLDYRDCGRFPYRIYPNILETGDTSGKKVTGLFLTMFFEFNYRKAVFEHSQATLRNILHDPIRRTFFDTKGIAQELERARPDSSGIDKNWDIDNLYYESADRESVLIKFAGNSKKVFHASQLFIAKARSDEHLFTVKADDLIHKSSNVSIQPLDELYEGLNLFETTPEEEAEIEELRRRYDLSSSQLVEKLWKILLIKLVDSDQKKGVYEQLFQIMQENGANMVGISHFETCWLDVKEDSLIPRSKRVFKLLCSFLELPAIYVRIMFKKRAKERLLSRQSSAKMNALIADLVQVGIFDDDHNKEEKKNYTKFFTDHDLEEIGFTSDSTEKEILTLVDLLRPNLNLKEVQQIEIRS